uniref:Uncharacterized protein n=1 Tax=Euplotes harpa TaxID=151035 RepID=A0A7S3NAX9_9SPIT|mmetsp:Transcript_41724/g.48189  ORF Transcript_41724/g.48189 Transcript_41724/m.48189 type:complete len:166 (+) Transcript_41724:372-869(+)|eukprot:CAMPEP_0168319496 /NCGR_PEP_ID=MMETSP0213-20121227/1092_1 /TAXON_ID=151035 /ORGANISM="Euplotes harpa, Strain FSP1.4" /LENGTH=165 /DNA_ID=CAMNT_0008320731 /DNA_START=371 /DNA_END=868 /DNA_ORIENTATION=-
MNKKDIEDLLASKIFEGSIVSTPQVARDRLIMTGNLFHSNDFDFVGDPFGLNYSEARSDSTSSIDLRFDKGEEDKFGFEGLNLFPGYFGSEFIVFSESSKSFNEILSSKFENIGSGSSFQELEDREMSIPHQNAQESDNITSSIQLASEFQAWFSNSPSDFKLFP